MHSRFGVLLLACLAASTPTQPPTTSSPTWIRSCPSYGSDCRSCSAQFNCFFCNTDNSCHSLDVLGQCAYPSIGCLKPCPSFGSNCTACRSQFNCIFCDGPGGGSCHSFDYLPQCLISNCQSALRSCPSFGGDCRACRSQLNCAFCNSTQSCHSMDYVLTNPECTATFCDNCTRTVPEQRGVLEPSALQVTIVLGGVLCLGLLIVSVAFCVLQCVRRSAARWRGVQWISLNALQQEQYEGHGRDSSPSVDVRPADDWDYNDWTVASTRGTAITPETARDTQDRYRAGLRNPLLSGQAAPAIQRDGYCRRCCTCCCHRYTRRVMTALLALSLCVLAAAGIYFFPHGPLFSLCNKSVDIGNSFTNLLRAYQHNLTNGTVDLYLRASVYNPNRLGVTVNDMRVKFMYHGVQIGRGSYTHAPVAAGNLMDFTMLAHFMTSQEMALNMFTDYVNGSLLLDVDFDIRSASVYAFEHKLLDASLVYTLHNYDVVKTQRAYCLCPVDNSRPY